MYFLTSLSKTKFTYLRTVTKASEWKNSRAHNVKKTFIGRYEVKQTRPRHLHTEYFGFSRDHVMRASRLRTKYGTHKMTLFSTTTKKWRHLAELDIPICGMAPMTVEHLLQDCTTHQNEREATWPTETPVVVKEKMAYWQICDAQRPSYEEPESLSEHSTKKKNFG